METYKATGKLISKTKVESIQSKDKKTTYQKRFFVIEQPDDKYPNFISFSLFGDKKVDLINDFKKDANIEVSFNLKGNKYEKDGTTKYFMDVQAWKIEELVESKAGGGDDGFSDSGPNDTDLPF